MDEGNHSIAAGQPWTVDYLRAEDAPGVVRLFLAVYGPHYPVRTFLDAERLAAENASGSIISSVARTPGGDIVGHTSLYRSAAHDQTYEHGASLVHPSYRGSGRIYLRLTSHNIREAAPRLGVRTIFGEPVLRHLNSQKLGALFKFVPMALEVDLMPAEAYDLEQGDGGRVSTSLDFFTVTPQPHRIHLPEPYAAFLEFLYGGLDDVRELAPAHGQPPAGRASIIEVRRFEFAQVTRISVPSIGEDLPAAIQALEAESGRTVVHQVWLPLHQPWVGWAVEILRRRGYFIGGALPRWFGQDGLLMQKVFGRPNWEGQKIHLDRVRRMAEEIRRDWERTSPAN